jgi:hypothetical protein
MTTYHQAEEYLKHYNHTRRVRIIDVVIYLIAALVH